MDDFLNESYDKEGGWTYIREQGSSVDYVVVNKKAEEKVSRMERDRTESDYVPLEVELEEHKISIKEAIKQERTKIIERSNWLEEGITEYRWK